MEIIWNFLVENWRVFVPILVELIVFIVLLCKKKVKITDTTIMSLLVKLPEFINLAEKTYSDGSRKYEMVVKLSLNYLGSICGLDEQATFKKYYDVVDGLIEAYLSTPQKKEKKDEKQNEQKT